MKTTVENLEGQFKKINVTIPSEIVNEKMNDYFSKLKKDVTLKGYRKGKAPIWLVKSMYGENAKGDITKDIVESTLGEALQKESLKPVEMPKIESKPLKEDNDFEFSAHFEHLPEVTLKDYSSYKIKATSVKVEDKDIQDTLDRLKDNFAEYKKEDDSTLITPEHFIKVSYKASENDIPFEPASQENSFLKVGEDFLHDDFVNNLKGMKAGESKSFTVTFPEPKKEEERVPVSGKTLKFEVNIHEVHTQTLLNDQELAEKLKLESFDALKTRLVTDLEQQKEQEQKSQYKEEYVKWLLKTNPFTAPKSLVEKQIQQLAFDSGIRLGQMGMNQEQVQNKLKEDEDFFKIRAAEQVVTSLFLGEISKKENISASSEDLQSEVARIAQNQGKKPEEIFADMQKRGLLMSLFQQLSELKTLDVMVDRALGIHEKKEDNPS